MGPPTVKYIAQLNDVRELALLGAADLSWWRDQLAGEGLEAVDVDGHAQVLVTALDAKWMGIPFRDLSVAVAARRADETGLFFAQAFNASRFLVFFERYWFHLPYGFRADVRAEPAAFSLGADVSARMAPREPAPEQEMGFAGPLFLPGRRWLRVNVHGATSLFDFDPARDRFEVGAGAPDPFFSGLALSQFRGRQWHVRESATHARSKTFRY